MKQPVKRPKANSSIKFQISIGILSLSVLAVVAGINLYKKNEVSEELKLNHWRFTFSTTKWLAATDMNSIVSSGDERTFWTAWVSPEVQSDGFSHVLRKYKIDCKQEQFTALAAISYDESGKIMDRDDTGQPAKAVLPNTPMFVQEYQVCNGKPMEGLKNVGWTEAESFAKAVHTGDRSMTELVENK